MRFTIERGVLLKALGHLQGVVERRNTIPILSNVLIAAEGGALSLAATDLDVEVVETAPANVVREGATTTPAHVLYDIVRRLPDGAQASFELAAAEQRLTLEAGRSKFQLACLPRDDFPAMASGALPHSFALDPADLRRIVDKTSFAISTEEARYYLNGIYIHVGEMDGGPRLIAVATDGHRLARFASAAPDGSAGMPGVIVPRKTVAELRKLADGAEAPVQVALSDRAIQFEFGQVRLTSKLIDGAFPDYQRVIPAKGERIVEIEADLLAEAVDRVSSISSDRTRGVKLKFTAEEVELSVNNPDTGTASDHVPCTYRGPAMEVGFNGRYLFEILRQIESRQARLLFTDPSAPTLIEDAEDGADAATLYVIMPMRV